MKTIYNACTQTTHSCGQITKARFKNRLGNIKLFLMLLLFLSAAKFAGAQCDPQTHPAPQVTISGGPQFICAGSTSVISYQDTVYLPGTGLDSAINTVTNTIGIPAQAGYADTSGGHYINGLFVQTVTVTLTGNPGSFQLTDTAYFRYSDGCLVKNFFSLPLTVLELSGHHSYTPIACVGGATTLTENAVGAVGGSFTFSLTPSGATAATNPAIFPGVTANTYTVNLSVTVSGTTCHATDTIHLLDGSPLASPSISEMDNSGVAANDKIICTGDCANLNAGTYTTYSWSNGTSTSSILVCPTSNTTYTVTVTNGNNCVATGTTTITVNALPTPSITETDMSGNVNNDKMICSGGCATLNAGSWSKYSWNTGATTSSIVVCPTSTTTYTVAVTNANNCTATATSTVTVNTLPPANCSNTGPITCTNPTPQVKVNSCNAASGITYSWTGPKSFTSTMQCPAISNQGTYTVTVNSSVTGCSNSCTTTVALDTVHPCPVCTPPPPISCANACTPLQVTNTCASNVSFTWTGPIGYAGTPCTSIAGSYTVTATDQTNGCSNTCSETVTGVASGYPITGRCSDNGSVYPSDYFQLTGDPNSNKKLSGDDWDVIYKGTSTTAQAISVGAPGWGGIIQDWPSNADNEFVEGTKDIGDIPSWSWATHSTPDKDDLLHAGAALYGGHYLYFFSDRYATNGDAQMGLWLFQGGVAPMGATKGGFSGQHQVGDLLILSDFTNGGGVANLFVYEWVGTGGNTFGTLNAITLSAASAYATVNTTSVNSPWPYNPKFGKNNVFPPGAFFEGGIDLECIVPNLANYDLCSFLFETRASQEPTAELKDFIIGGVAHNPNIPRIAQLQENGSTTGNGNISLTAYPNPFNNITTIEVLPNIDYSNATLDLYDVKGQKVRSLFTGAVVANQSYHFQIDGSTLARGVYFYSFRAEGENINGKVILIK